MFNNMRDNTLKKIIIFITFVLLTVCVVFILHRNRIIEYGEPQDQKRVSLRYGEGDNPVDKSIADALKRNMKRI